VNLDDQAERSWRKASPMKTICVLLSFTIVLVGCYSQSSLTKDESVPNNEAVVFYLKDGRYIKSKPEEHTRTDTGYQVVGELVKNKQTQGRFEGVIHDSDIQKVTANTLDIVSTSIAVVFGAVMVLVVVGVIVLAPH
jgi:hypothetical protein